jgi:diadenosine tetraphosphate (Ap4A) HIT family hydrolase
MTSDDTWMLDPRLAGDTAPVGDLPLSRVLAMKDANYPWLILVPRRAGAVELIDLAPSDQVALIGEIDRASHALKMHTHCDKLNIAALGNVVPQLHVHVVARFKNDAAGSRAVWGVAPAKPYPAQALTSFAHTMRDALGLE